MRKWYIVGAGLTGSVLAERIANELGESVTVIEKRNHIGGNCWSEFDEETGIEVHKYGSHIFHTSNEEVWKYISRFTDWNDYRHHVWTSHNSKIYPLPINLATINSFYGVNLSPGEAEKFVRAEAEREKIREPANLEEKAVSLIGRPLYEAFIKGYTKKQWEKDPKDLGAEIITRLPVRFNYNNRYFADKWEGIPLSGYASLFKRLLNHPNIEIRLGTDWRYIKDEAQKASGIIYTGPLDEFFEYALGKLEWRTVEFETERYDYRDYQGTTVVNNADEACPYTRIHEFKHYHPERKDTGKTIIYREYSRTTKTGDIPFYPVSTEKNRRLADQYQCMAQKRPNVYFCGRLAQYRYLDMDKAIAEALNTFRQIKADCRVA